MYHCRLFYHDVAVESASNVALRDNALNFRRLDPSVDTCLLLISSPIPGLCPQCRAFPLIPRRKAPQPQAESRILQAGDQESPTDKEVAVEGAGSRRGSANLGSIGSYGGGLSGLLQERTSDEGMEEEADTVLHSLTGRDSTWRTS